MMPRLEEIFVDRAPTEKLLEAWNRLPALYEAGPLIVTTTSGEGGSLLATELVRRLAIEQSERDGNDYWCCSSPGPGGGAFARANECVLDALDRYKASPSLPFLWIEFPDSRGLRDEMGLLQAIRATARTFRKRGVGRFEEERKRWENIGRQVGEALSTSTFDAVVEAWAPSVVGGETAEKIGRAGAITDTAETALDLADGIVGDADQEARAIQRGAAHLARECFAIAKASSFVAGPMSCESLASHPLFPKQMVPLVIAAEKIEWQGVGCVEFLRAIVAACGKDPWPVLIVTTADNLAAARQILCSNIHSGDATLGRIDDRVFEAGSEASADAGKPASGAASPCLEGAIERAQDFCLERQRALQAEEVESGDATGEAIRLRNEVARCARFETHPRLLDVAFGLLCMALAGATRPPRHVWERLAILESAGPELQPWMQAALDRPWPAELVDMVTEIALLRLQELFPLYRGVWDLEGLRALCSDEGPLFTLAKVYQRYGLDELPLLELFEDYLLEVSRLRPAALASGEGRAHRLRERVGKAHPELVQAMEIRRIIRLGQSQFHLKNYAEAVETLAGAATSNSGSDAPKPQVASNAQLIKRIMEQARKQLGEDQRQLEGGGMLRQSLQLIGRVWGGRPFTP